MVFQTNDVTKGWDGRSNGINLDGGTFIWVYKYKLDGGEPEIKKGVGLLVG